MSVGWRRYVACKARRRQVDRAFSLLRRARTDLLAENRGRGFSSCRLERALAEAELSLMRVRKLVRDSVSDAKRSCFAPGAGTACAYCGCTIDDPSDLTIDHLAAKARGGSDSPSHLVACCRECNSRKGSMRIQRFLQAERRRLNDPGFEFHYTGEDNAGDSPKGA